jgi:LEA14-like dessication related protein
MMLRARLGRVAAISIFASFLATGAACSKPKDPQLTPQEAKVTSVDMTGLDLRVKMDAFNPNGFPLAVRKITAHVVVDGSHDLGTVTIPQPIDLPAKAHTTVDVPMKVEWESVASLVAMTSAKRPLGYVVDGTATVGGEKLNVELPFKLQGVISPHELQQAAINSLRGTPGLQVRIPQPAPTK